MSWKEWLAAVLVVGFGIFLQIPDRDEMEVEEDAGREVTTSRPQSADAGERQGPYRTVALEVTGMT